MPTSGSTSENQGVFMRQLTTIIYSFFTSEHRREKKISILVLSLLLCISFLPAPVQAFCSYPATCAGGGSFSICCATQKEAEDYVISLNIPNICNVTSVVLSYGYSETFNGYVSFKQCGSNGESYGGSQVYFGIPTVLCPDNNSCCFDPTCDQCPVRP